MMNNVKNIVVLLFLLLSRSYSITSNDPESPQLLDDICDSNQGRTSVCEVEIDVPEECASLPSGTSNCPIVFFFHGAGGTNNWFARTTGVHSQGFIGVYPQGENGWNTGPKDTNQCEWDDFDCIEDPDEGAFIASIIKRLREMDAIGNIFCIGNSNGAALSMRLAANAGDELPIKGIVTKVTQLLAEPNRNGPGVLNSNQPNSSTLKVSVLNIMGTADPVIPYEGGTAGVLGNNDPNFKLMHALESMKTWASHNDCNETPTESTVSSSMGTDGFATYYEYDCPEGMIVQHYAVHGGGHDVGATELDGEKLDYDMAYDFIRELETFDEPSPVSSPAVSPPTECIDDADWHGKYSDTHNCAYVALQPLYRCNFENSFGWKASDACKASCDTCDDGSQPVAAPQTDVPTSSPITSPTAVSCSDDPIWHGKMNEAHTCSFVALEPALRCYWKGLDGTLASESCRVACDTCDNGTRL